MIFNHPIKTDNIVKACDYSKVIKSFGKGTTWVATQDCWIYATRLYLTMEGNMTITIDGQEVAYVRGDNYTNSTYVSAGGFFVKKGSEVKVTGSDKPSATVKAFACLK